MWMLLGINAVLLAGLLFTVWQLRRLQVALTNQKAGVRAAVHRAVKPVEPRRREAPRRTALDEFPSEASVEDAAARPAQRRPRPSPGGRSSDPTGAGRPLARLIAKARRR